MIIIRLLTAFFILYLLYRVARWFLSPSGKTPRPLPSRQSPAKTEDLVEDPCCHAYLPVSQAYQVSIDGKTVYFCSKKCYQNYVRNRGTDKK